MSRIIVVHSSRGDLGKSTIAANLACHYTVQGLRVGVIEANLQSPGIQYAFGLEDGEVTHTVNDYLWGRIDIKQAAFDVTSSLESLRGGKYPVIPRGVQLFVIPSSGTFASIMRVQREGYDVGLLNDGFHALIEDLNLDVLIIDTRPGFAEESTFCAAICDSLLLCMRPDAMYYQNSAVLVEIARKVDVPAMFMFINMVPAVFNPTEVKTRVDKTFGIEVVGVAPFIEELAYKHGSATLALEKPEDIWAQQIQAAADMLMR
jgi:MinD-like ATPase involved in chromosome partitioning or flagellar assembly